MRSERAGARMGYSLSHPSAAHEEAGKTIIGF